VSIPRAGVGGVAFGGRGSVPPVSVPWSRIFSCSAVLWAAGIFGASDLSACYTLSSAGCFAAPLLVLTLCLARPTPGSWAAVCARSFLLRGGLVSGRGPCGGGRGDYPRGGDFLVSSGGAVLRVALFFVFALLFWAPPWPLDWCLPWLPWGSRPRLRFVVVPRRFLV